jgi:hypothetical protein
MINKGFLKDFNKDALAALEKVAADYGVAIKQGGSRFTDTNANIKFELSAITSSGEVQTPEAQEFKRSAARFGLHPDDLGGTFTSQGTQYRITGLKTRRPKYPVTGARVSDGRTFKFPASSVTNVIQKNTGRRAAIASQKSREPLTEEIKSEFVTLACQLSPENISCDGERSRADVRKATAVINRKWAALEARIGQRVSESEAFAFED